MSEQTTLEVAALAVASRPSGYRAIDEAREARERLTAAGLASSSASDALIELAEVRARVLGLLGRANRSVADARRLMSKVDAGPFATPTSGGEDRQRLSDLALQIGAWDSAGYFKP